MYKSIFAPDKKFFNSGNNIRIEEYLQDYEEKKEGIISFWSITVNNSKQYKGKLKDFYLDEIEEYIKAKGSG